MEKVEKVLLLVVLGAAMTIVAVMSFQSDSKSETAGGDQAKSQIENPAAKDPAKDGTKSIGDLIKDGPELDLPGKTPPGGDNAKPDNRLAPRDAGGSKLPAGAGQRPSTDPAGDNPKDHESDEPKLDEPEKDDTNIVTPAFLDFERDPSGPGLFYTVRDDDTFSEIVRRYCGTAASDVQDRILKLNEGMDKNHIQRGDTILFPADLVKRLSAPRALGTKKEAREASADRSTNPEIAPTVSRSYRIKYGDTLWDLAVSRVGKGKADAYIRKIKALNPKLDPRHLMAGRSILLPD